MKFKIIVDSSSNLTNDYLKDSNILFESVPLSIRLGNKDYVDDENLNIKEFMNDLSSFKGKTSHSSCPTASAYLSALTGADYYFIVTFSKKLSGSYNVAHLAISQFDKPDNVFLIDSKAVAGSMILIVDKLVELINSNMEFNEIKEKILEYRNSLKLLFILDSFDNLIRNGRMSKAVAFIATLMKIKPLCYADDGEINVKEKIRTLEGVIKRLVANIGKMTNITKENKVIICHTQDEENANKIKKLITENYELNNIRIIENRGLCSFYSLLNGMIVSFE